MYELTSLLRNHLYQRTIVMTQYVDRNATKEVNVFFSFDIVEIDTIAMIEDNLIAVEDREIALLVFFKNLLRCFFHLNSSFHCNTCVPIPFEVKISSMIEWGRRPSII